MTHPASYLRVGALALLWGASFLLIKVALTALSPVQIAFTRIALGAAVLAVLCAVRGIRLRGDRRLWAHVAVAGFFASALPWVLFAIGERTVDSGLAGVLNATTPLWTILFGYLAGTQRELSPRMLAGLAVGFGGVLLIMAPWHGAAGGIGLVACIGATASYGIGYVHIGRNLTGARDGRPAPAPLTMAAMQLTAATGLAAFALPLDGFPPVHFDLVPLLAVAALGVFGTGVGFALNYRLIADEGPTAAATVTYLMPIVSVLLGALVLDEQIGIRAVLGIALVLTGVALSRKPRAPRITGARTYTDLAINHPMK
ncbi:DMT family transporter [Saccharopolyspora gloriosae]|uniref:DMT family transporter n=1 Tax=Saccharopolyspora gloriosae TaxID=455344 RepID=UPI001FB78D8C|nr:EamA family transporter [Saccharopolyspora gloriosae]